METKIITPALAEALSVLSPAVIPTEYRYQAMLKGIKDIYMLTNSELQYVGISSDVVVVFKNNTYLELQIVPHKVEAVIQILS